MSRPALTEVPKKRGSRSPTGMSVVAGSDPFGSLNTSLINKVHSEVATKFIIRVEMTSLTPW